MKPLERLVTAAAGLFTLAILALHFCLTLAYVFPLNPLKASSMPRLQTYMDTLFSQNWSLFAPNPQHTNLGVLIQCKDNRGATTSWYDLEGAFLKGLHRYPFGPYVRLVRMPTDALRSYDGSDVDHDLLNVLAAACKSSVEKCLLHDSDYLRSNERGKLELQGLASSACSQIVGNSAIAVRALGTESPLRPWSQRDSRAWRPVSVVIATTGWMPYRNVAPMRLDTSNSHPEDGRYGQH